ncbi:type II toxin-antitoxin system RelE/ParE family toxin, partial [Coraliomargarita sp. SDUM461004]
RVALRKLIQMNRARDLADLSVPPGNRLEALKGDLMGFHSIRINRHLAREARRWSARRDGSTELPEAGALRATKEQWRIVFRWTEQGPADVQIQDYH